MNKEKMLHLFQYPTIEIINKLNDIKYYGWDSVLISPVQPSKEEYNWSWYMNYQITSLSIGNKYGTK